MTAEIVHMSQPLEDLLEDPAQGTDAKILSFVPRQRQADDYPTPPLRPTSFQEGQRKQAEIASNEIRAIGKSATADSVMFPDLAITDQLDVLAQTGQPYTADIRPQTLDYQPDEESVAAIAERILGEADAKSAGLNQRVTIEHGPDNTHQTIHAPVMPKPLANSR